MVKDEDFIIAGIAFSAFFDSGRSKLFSGFAGEGVGIRVFE